MLKVNAISGHRDQRRDSLLPAEPRRLSWADQKSSPLPVKQRGLGNAGQNPSQKGGRVKSLQHFRLQLRARPSHAQLRSFQQCTKTQSWGQVNADPIGSARIETCPCTANLLNVAGFTGKEVDLCKADRSL